VLPTAWAEAGAAPYNNVIGVDPGLRDPEGGDFTAERASDYGCRVFGRAVAAVETVEVAELVEIRRDRLDVGGVVNVDTVWDAAVIQVTDDVTVEANATLRIAAGARVEFMGFHNLRVQDGSLQAVGTPTEPIVFTSSQPVLWNPDLTMQGAWNGLTFMNVPVRCDSSRVQWCVLECSKALPGENLRQSDRVGGTLVPGMGGAVRIVGASPVVVSHSILRRNLARFGGAVAVHYGAAPLLVNNLFTDNHATLGGAGVYASYSYPRLVHNTMVGNVTEAPSAFNHTGCVDHFHSKPLHVGSIIWGNPTSYYDNLQIKGAKAYYTRYCNVEDWVGGEGCLSVDPELDGFGPEPMAPQPGSPMVDAGSVGEAGWWLSSYDLGGGTRVVGAEVDMGAYELSPVTGVDLLPAMAVIPLDCAPNPFNPRTEISWIQPRQGSVDLSIYDLRGRLVRRLVNGPVEAGRQVHGWDGKDRGGRAASSGMYCIRLRTGAGWGMRKVAYVP